MLQKQVSTTVVPTPAESRTPPRGQRRLVDADFWLDEVLAGVPDDLYLDEDFTDAE
jgi:hypothetical protein